jgi:putative endonuclease
MPTPSPLQKTKRQQAWKAGFFREILGAWYLRFKGYKILEQRYKTPLGEIDLVAQKGNRFVFVEVKYRETINNSLESLKSTQQQRILKGAQYYLMKQGLNPNDTPMQFDGLFFSKGFLPKHIQNAWGGK